MTIEYDEGSGVPDIYGHISWRLNGMHHRLDGPAIEWFNGSKYWYVNGNLHRLEGPAVEYSNGNTLWYLNGELAFVIRDQKIIIGEQVTIEDSVAIVLKQINKNIFIALLGNQKVFIQTTFFTKYRVFFKKCLTFFSGMI